MIKNQTLLHSAFVCLYRFLVNLSRNRLVLADNLVPQHMAERRSDKASLSIESSSLVAGLGMIIFLSIVIS
jgi:hypothetical protein